MAFIKLGTDHFEQFTIVTYPKRTFTSASNESLVMVAGVTGSVPLFARRSKIEKEPRPLGAFQDSVANDQDLEIYRLAARSAALKATPGTVKIRFHSAVADQEGVTIYSTPDDDGISITGSFEWDTDSSYRDGSIPVVAAGFGAGDSATAFVTALRASNVEIDAEIDGNGFDVTLTQQRPGALGNTFLSQSSGFNSDTSITDAGFVATEHFGGGSDIGSFIGPMNDYIRMVHSQSVSAKKKKKLEIIRFEPSFTYTRSSGIKSSVRKVMMPYYRSVYSGMDYGYTNYNSLNFFTGTLIPTSSALIYPNAYTGSTGVGSYTPTGSFTFDFFINPRYTTEAAGKSYRPGGIFHLSSTYAVSLTTGSSVDINGRPDGFRLILQVTHSADLPPSQIAYTSNINTGTKRYRSHETGSAPYNYVFLSDDNALRRNHWHHVAIRWGSSQINQGTGSFMIDGVERGTFTLPLTTIAQPNYSSDSPRVTDPQALFIGNYYNGFNAGSNLIEQFFNTTVAGNEGLSSIGTATSDPTDSSGAAVDSLINHPLNAELHELKIFDHYRTDDQVLSSSVEGPDDTKGMLFYLPPFFVKESRSREVPISPFQTTTSTTDDPFNVSLSFGTGGHLINAENFLRDFVTKEYPRLYQLTASMITYTTSENLETNEYLYASGSVRARNLLLLPCDNGKFSPNFDLLISGTKTLIPTTGSMMSKFVTDNGALDLSFITLNDLIPTGSFRKSITQDSGSLAGSVMGGSPESPGVASGDVLSVFQRTGDNSSNEITFFDISNMYYGKRIKPGTLTIKDPAVTGSNGHVSIILKDDGRGMIYRADTLSEQAKWNNIGNVFYDEGVVLLKTPHLPRFGKDQFEISFQGEQDIHVMTVNVPCPKGMINSSSNPAYQIVSATLDANDSDSEFVYITGINFHDDNFNIIARTSLAQPILKRSTDKYLFKAKIDF